MGWDDKRVLVREGECFSLWYWEDNGRVQATRMSSVAGFDSVRELENASKSNRVRLTFTWGSADRAI